MKCFGHPLATLAVANEHLDAIGETPHLFKQKLRSKWYRRQKLESITAMRQKAVLDVVQEISDDSEIIAQWKEKHLIEREILHCR